MFVIALTTLLLLGPTPTPVKAPAPKPALTELDRLRIENADLQIKLAAAYDDTDTCRVALAPYLREVNLRAVAEAKTKLKAEIEAAHPGFTFTPPTEGRPAMLTPIPTTTATPPHP